MARTNLDIDTPILDELKQLGKLRGKSLGQLVSVLLAESLASSQPKRPPEELRWIARPMGARVSFEDKEALQDDLSPQY